MPCHSAEELAALFDGVLPRAQAQKLRHHLMNCPRCANEIRQLDRMLANSAQVGKPSSEFMKRALAIASHKPAIVSEQVDSRPEKQANVPSGPSRSSR